MNNQSYGVPPKHWPPEMSPWWFHWSHPIRKHALRRQKIERVDVVGLERLEASLRSGHGVLIAPNHSFHWDSYCLASAAERLATPFYIMTAWQVFDGSSCKIIRRFASPSTDDGRFSSWPVDSVLASCEL